VRDAGRDDLYALQQAPDPLDPFDFRPDAARGPAQELRRARSRTSPATRHDRYVCNGVNEVVRQVRLGVALLGRPRLDRCRYRRIALRPVKPDDRIYKLELAVGKKGEHDSTTHYRLRPATSEERATTGAPPPTPGS
jgi:hypothetical protein